MKVIAKNLATGKELTYIGESMTPRLAVICAYAQQEKNDYNTWDYEERYGDLVETGYFTQLCGDWSALDVTEWPDPRPQCALGMYEPCTWENKQPADILVRGNDYSRIYLCADCAVGIGIMNDHGAATRDREFLCLHTFKIKRG